jgi:hypothetical protein
MAGVGVGIYASLKDCASSVRNISTIKPDAERHRLYEPYYGCSASCRAEQGVDAHAQCADKEEIKNPF